MLSRRQIKFRDDLLSPIKLRFYFLQKLPMGLITGIKLVQLDEHIAVTEVPYRWTNKNPFQSMYFAVQSMAAELSTAAHVLLALKGLDADVALIIVDMKAEFAKKAKTKITFTCLEYEKINNAVSQLKHKDDTASVVLKTVGRNLLGEEVSTFYFTWSFKRRT